MFDHARRVAPLLFASGFCALVYQIAWTREFRLVFGASTAASAAVLATFICGLGAGGLIIGRRVDRHPRPLLLYANLEILIALTAAASPWLLWLVRQVYIALGGTVVLGDTVGTVLRLLLSALVLAVPTWAMGGTLPAAARAVAGPQDEGRRSVALLYGVNTLGAVAGAFLATFSMLEVFGTRRMLWLACLANLLVALAARQVARRLPEVEPDGEQTVGGGGEPAPARFVVAAAAVVGFAFFLMELVWYRMLGPILGGSVYTFGLILSVALLGIGLGGAIYSLFRANRPATVAGFAVTCLVEAVCLALPFALGDRLAVLALLLRPLGAIGLFWGQVLGWTVVCSIVVLPAAIVAGYQFPLLIALLGRGGTSVGRHAGLAYAWNTAGAIAGSLAGGFGLLPLLSAPGVWRATSLLLVFLGVAAALVGRRHVSGRRGLVVPASLTVATLALLATSGPTAGWRHGGIGAGRAQLQLTSPNAVRDWLHEQRRSIQWEGDGFESSVAVKVVGAGDALVINGKIDGNARSDAPTMIMSGLLGAFVHPHPRNALVIGLGSGTTAGWLADVPGIERVDVVEIERLVLRMAEDSAPVNRGAMKNPRLHVSIGDAREVLLVARDTYDIVFSQPSNPYRAGVASLFTQEFYEAVNRRLAAGGVFVQWVQAYEIDGKTLRTIYATMASVFPEIQTWQAGPGDLVLVATREPMRHDAAALRARLRQEPYRTGVDVAWRVDDLEGVLAHYVAGPSFARALAANEKGILNNDDRNIVEFGFARTVGQSQLEILEELRRVSAGRGDNVPGGLTDVDWGRVADSRLTLNPRGERTGEQQILFRVFERFGAGDTAAALAAWRSLGREPRSAIERHVLALSLADTGDEGALAQIEAFRAAQPVDADILLARWLYRRGRYDEALAPLEAALVGLRTDPWPSFIDAALDWSLQIAERRPQAAQRLFDLLVPPFAVHRSDMRRLNTLAGLLRYMNEAPACAGLVGPLEPYIPWTRDWLSLRLRCYRAVGDARAAEAEADLRQFLTQEGEFKLGLEASPPAAAGAPAVPLLPR